MSELVTKYLLTIVKINHDFNIYNETETNCTFIRIHATKHFDDN